MSQPIKYLFFFQFCLYSAIKKPVCGYQEHPLLFTGIQYFRKHGHFVYAICSFYHPSSVEVSVPARATLMACDSDEYHFPRLNQYYSAIRVTIRHTRLNLLNLNYSVPHCWWPSAKRLIKAHITRFTLETPAQCSSCWNCITAISARPTNDNIHQEHFKAILISVGSQIMDRSAEQMTLVHYVFGNIFLFFAAVAAVFRQHLCEISLNYLDAL